MNETAATLETPATVATPRTRICSNCCKSFTPARADAKFCCAGCRLKAHRRAKTADSQTTDTPAKTSTKRSSKPAKVNYSKATAPNSTTRTPQQPETNGGAHQDSGGEAEAKPIGRDDRGQFVRGHIGGPGRPPGSKNKLTEDFIADFHEVWVDSGLGALKHMVKNDPSAFVRAAAQLMPKDVLIEARGAGLMVFETPTAIKALLEAWGDLGGPPLSLTGPVIEAEVDEVPVAAASVEAPSKPDGEQ